MQKWCHSLWSVWPLCAGALLAVAVFASDWFFRAPPIEVEPPPAPVEQLTLDTVLRIREDVALTRTELAVIRRMLERLEARIRERGDE